MSGISWTQKTVNAITGCDRYSAGCKNCYALRQMPRMAALHPEKYGAKEKVVCHDGVLEKAVAIGKPTMFFVNSMSDTFHKEVPVDFLKGMFETMTNANQHTFQVLTKRAERLADLAPELNWPENIWMGVTVEANRYLHRVELLKTVPANVRFLSIEPLLDELTDLTPSVLDGIDWVIVGGESGPGARLMDLTWAEAICDTSRAANTPFFFKQKGSLYGPKKGGNTLNGEVIEEWPDLDRIKSRGLRNFIV